MGLLISLLRLRRSWSCHPFSFFLKKSGYCGGFSPAIAAFV
jgi:hypothetical protein